MNAHRAISFTVSIGPHVMTGAVMRSSATSSSLICSMNIRSTTSCSTPNQTHKHKQTHTKKKIKCTSEIFYRTVTQWRYSTVTYSKTSTKIYAKYNLTFSIIRSINVAYTTLYSVSFNSSTSSSNKVIGDHALHALYIRQATTHRCAYVMTSLLYMYATCQLNIQQRQRKRQS